jgi:hypothetical protein
VCVVCCQVEVCCVCCVLSSRGLCDELITRPDESDRLWCVSVCDLQCDQKVPVHLIITSQSILPHCLAANRQGRGTLYSH